MALMVIELEPPVMEKLRAHLMRISVVAAVAGVVLLAFADRVVAERGAPRRRRAPRRTRAAPRCARQHVVGHGARAP